MPYHISSSISQQIRREVAPSPDYEYGKEARIQVPILMLYPESYVDDCEFLKDAPLVKQLDKHLWYEPEGTFGSGQYSQNELISVPYRKRYIRTNEGIKENFKDNFKDNFNSYIKK